MSLPWSCLVALLVSCGDKDGSDDTGPVGTTPADTASEDSGTDGGAADGGTADGGTPDTGDDCDDPLTWYYDADGDLFGDEALAIEACDRPAGYVDVSGDCDDIDAAVNPAVVEYCDGVDNDCDGVIDPDTSVDAALWYADADGDSFGGESEAVASCDAPVGRVDNTGDCNDDQPLAWTGATEICGDGVDNDCDGLAGCALPDSGDIDTHGYFLAGPSTAEGTGTAVAHLGDVDGDGIGDLAVGSPYHSTHAGQIYVVRGPVTADQRLGDVDDRLVMGTSTTGTYPQLGWRVEAAGDHDGDGYGDILVGTVGWPDTSPSERGSGFLVHGPISGSFAVATDGLQVTGASGQLSLGGGLAPGADLTGDGQLDLVIAAPSSGYTSSDVWLIPGPLTASGDVDDVGLRLYEEQVEGYTGLDLVAGSDLDGDGVGDLVVSAPTCDVVATDQGRVYLLAGPITGDMDLADADAMLDATSSGTYFGVKLAAGDLDGDGQADLAVGAYLADYGSTSSAGEAFVFAGPLSGALTSADAVAHVVGQTGFGYAGYDVAVGDLDGDGFDDLAVGEPGSGLLVPGAHLVLGPVSGALLVGDADRTWTSSTNLTQAGVSLATGADITGDAAPDLLVGGSGTATVGGAWVIPGGGL